MSNGTELHSFQTSRNVVRFTLRPTYPRGECTQYPLHRRVSEPHSRSAHNYATIKVLKCNFLSMKHFIILAKHRVKENISHHETRENFGLHVPVNESRLKIRVNATHQCNVMRVAATSWLRLSQLSTANFWWSWVWLCPSPQLLSQKAPRQHMMWVETCMLVSTQLFVLKWECRHFSR